MSEAVIQGEAPAGAGPGAGRSLGDRLERSDRLFRETGSYDGLDGRLELKESDPILFEKIFSRLRGGLVSRTRRRARLQRKHDPYRRRSAPSGLEAPAE